MKLQKLNVLGNVLYVAAHPDDENTSLITYMANEKKFNAAYFSFTRGDGGQNLIGPEIREELGLIRTQELLAARRIDNGQQFFSRAVDFGYSKHPDETFNIWDKKKVLGDLVWVIRKFRPDVIVTRFNTVPGTTHGHHTASAILASEAFDLAGDNTQYPEQLTYVEPWQPKSLYWNAYFWRRSEYQKDTSELLSYDIGKYNALLGCSYSEISALSRSSHRSQGFGATGDRGVKKDYLQFEKGDEADNEAFEDIDVSWGRVEGGKQLQTQVDQLIKSYDATRPELILDQLLALRNNVSKLEDTFWKNIKMGEIDEIIYAITGLFLEVSAADYTACPGETVKLSVEAVNRSNAMISLKSVLFKPVGVAYNYSAELENNKKEKFTSNIMLAKNMIYSQPYWLADDHDLGTFSVSDQLLIGKGENDPDVTAEFTLLVNGTEIIYSRPVIYKKNDPVRGEVYRPFVVSPPILANINGGVKLFTNGKQQEVKVDVLAGSNDQKGTVSLNLPDSWKVVPAQQDFELNEKGESQTFIFKVAPPSSQESAQAKAIVVVNGQSYDHSLTEINYDHIPAQLLFNKNDVKFVNIDLQKGNDKIGYIMGAGDNIPDHLRQIGYEVDIINDESFAAETLDKYATIILGVRALNTVQRLKFEMPALLDFVKRGGNLIMQYNTSHRLVTKDFSPYELELSRNRVAVEEAPIRILDSEHEVMNYPNKIDQRDFENWVQERGLYFPDKWAEEFDTVLSSNDPSEDPLDGGLLIAKYGQGHYIYSSYSWFRELPAGVPGAYRLFVNLISIGSQGK